MLPLPALMVIFGVTEQPVWAQSEYEAVQLVDSWLPTFLAVAVSVGSNQHPDGVLAVSIAAPVGAPKQK